jgi:hypothetical protein
VTRYYFHLADEYDVIPDETGVDVTDLEDACCEAIKAIYEFRQGNSATAAEWKNWRIEVTDAWGDIAMTVGLSSLEIRRTESTRRERVLC